jgi:hypothetical protein
METELPRLPLHYTDNDKTIGDIRWNTVFEP